MSSDRVVPVILQSHVCTVAGVPDVEVARVLGDLDPSIAIRDGSDGRGGFASDLAAATGPSTSVCDRSSFPTACLPQVQRELAKVGFEISLYRETGVRPLDAISDDRLDVFLTQPAGLVEYCDRSCPAEVAIRMLESRPESRIVVVGN